VLSAVEGLEEVSTSLTSWVIPIAIVILLALFLAQSRGTGAMGRVFGPIMVVWFATLGLLGLLSWFGLSLFKTLKERLSPEKLQAAMLAKVDQVLPPLSQKLVDSATAVAPIYGDLAVKRLEKVRPQLETMVIDESGKFADRVRTTLVKESEAGMQRVTDRMATDLKRQLPNVSESKLDAIEKRLRDSLLVAGGDVVDQVEKKFGTERKRIEELLGRLPVDEVAKESEDKLQRNFIHQLLMLIDQAVMAENSPLK
jgi:hypothetical protein